jgi:hypothetical protein
MDRYKNYDVNNNKNYNDLEAINYKLNQLQSNFVNKDHKDISKNEASLPSSLKIKIDLTVIGSNNKYEG